MKKCASCTKDLPDAALHCVFCGAKQAPAGAAAAGNGPMVKTVMGYSQAEVLEQLKASGQAIPPALAAKLGGAPAAPVAPPPAAPAPPAAFDKTGMPPAGPISTLAGDPRPKSPSVAPAPVAPPIAAPPIATPPIAPPPSAAPISVPSAPPARPPGPDLGMLATLAAEPPRPTPHGVAAIAPGAATLVPMSPDGPSAPHPIFGSSSPAVSPPASSPGLGVPVAGAQAATMFAQSPFAQSAQSAQPVQPVQPINPMAATLAAPSTPAYSPQPVPVGAPAYSPPPVAAPAYLSQGSPASNTGRPVEPWKDGLRIAMFIWGAVLLLAFIAPTNMSPIQFSWSTILHGEGSAKIGPLVIGASALLALLFAAMPLATAVRGALALVLGLAGIVTPIVLAGHLPSWQHLAVLGGTAMILPGLLLRDEYRDSILPRLLVTIGVVAILATLLVPRDGALPIVTEITRLIDAPSLEGTIMAALGLVDLIFLLMALLVWLPAPSSGAAKVTMWLTLAWPFVIYVVGLVLAHKLGAIADRPVIALQWASGGDGTALAFPLAFAALLTYGAASLLGKSLED